MATFRNLLSKLNVFERFALRRSRKPLQEVQLSQGNIYILPNKASFLLALALIVMTLASLNYNNNLGFLFTFIIASSAFISIYHTYNNLVLLKVSVTDQQPAFAGESINYSLLFQNQQKHARFGINAGHKGADLRQAQFDVDAGAKQIVGLLHESYERGLHPLKRIKITTSFPLGLFTAWSYINLDRQLVVYPRPVDKAMINTLDDAVMSGQRDSHKSGNDDFVGYREYQFEDGCQRIDWKAYARTGQLYNKTFSHNESGSLMFSWNAVPGEDTEARLSILCRLLIDAEAQGIEFGLELPHQTIALGHGQQHLHHCLKQLALFP